ncbi:PASTA domain-containing protein [Streptomycetaceae bacterium NBC_01309]
MVHCILCGTGNDLAAQYCAGLGCGADLAAQRDGDTSLAVQVDCEPAEVEARPGDTVATTLTLRNAGSIADKYVLELRRDIGDRITVERHGKPGDVLAGELCVWTVRYTVPPDWSPAAHLVGSGGLFDGTGPDPTAYGAPVDDAIVVPLRVVSTLDRRVAAGATLTVRPFSGVPEPDEFPSPRAARARRNQARRTQMAAAGAVAAVAVVVALIVGMAAAGSGGGGGKKDPTRKAGATSTAPSATGSGGDSPAPMETVPTDIPSSEAPTSTTPTATRTPSATRTTKPPTTRPPSTAPGPGVPTVRPPTATQPTVTGSASNSPDPTPQEVPNVIGETYPSARSILSGADLRVARSDSSDAACLEGSARTCTVVAQSPSKGPIEPGMTVTLTLRAPQASETPSEPVPG